MRKRKYYLYLTAEERRYIFNALLAFRNKLIAQGRYTDAVDKVMIKLKVQQQLFRTWSAQMKK